MFDFVFVDTIDGKIINNLCKLVFIYQFIAMVKAFMKYIFSILIIGSHAALITKKIITYTFFYF